MQSITFKIPGKPVGKGRPRFAKRGNFVHTYTPEKTANYETLVGWYAKQAMLNGGFTQDIGSAFMVSIYVVVAIPKSTPKKLLAMMPDSFCLKKPDLDNIIKTVLDGMNGIIYADDKQVAGVFATKKYGTEDSVRVKVERI